MLLLCFSHDGRPVYLCGEVEGNDGRRVIVPLVCKENWEELMRYSTGNNGLTVRLEVKKLSGITSSSQWGML